MTCIKKNKARKPIRRTKRSSKENFPTLDDLVLDRSLPQVHVKVFPSRKKSGTKPGDRLVIELQCEV